MITKDSKILVTGVKGQLGYDCLRELKERGYKNILGIDREELDITDEKAVHKFINDFKPDVIMHNAAWTAVDKAEQMPEAVYAVNALGPKYIAEACKEVNAAMFYISTDYVFDGKGDEPFEVNDPKNGLSVYGKTKAQGEDFVTAALKKFFIIRISWVFGLNGHNFIKTMLKLAETHKDLNVVSDQIGSPTYTYDLSKLMCDMMVTDKYGIYQATNEGFCSWSDFAEEIFKDAGEDVTVHPVTTEEYRKMVPNQADRPLNSRMSKLSLDQAGFNRMPSWQDATRRYIGELKKEGGNV
jgi:dTDP-4-dehydrorhamnose reductase